MAEEDSAPTKKAAPVPRRPLTSARLPQSVPIVGLGCSSFSTFFWSPNDEHATDSSCMTAETLVRSHSAVQEWIQTIQYAILKAGITLLDTAPWYGHGTSEIVIGWALEAMTQTLQEPSLFRRETIMINTKIGRYQADPALQFDYSRETTLASARRSLDRMKCGYIDVLQLHDPEYAPSLDQLLEETLPAMVECRNKGGCRALGMTGYPLKVQHLILQRSMEHFGESIWDQALTYSHFNLHDTSLFTKELCSGDYASFFDYCRDNKMEVLAAAPLSMGLLTHQGPPEWHPASDELKRACQEAAVPCKDRGVDISTVALVFALSDERIPCTILGMKNVNEVRFVQSIAIRIGQVVREGSVSRDEILKAVLSENEQLVLERLQDRVRGPFASVVTSGLNEWDGVKGAREFWEQQGKSDVCRWQ